MPQAHTFPEPTAFTKAADSFELNNMTAAVPHPQVFPDKKYGWDDNFLEKDIARRVTHREALQVDYLETEIKRLAGVSELAVATIAKDRKCKLYPFHTSKRHCMLSTNQRCTR